MDEGCRAGAQPGHLGFDHLAAPTPQAEPDLSSSSNARRIVPHHLKQAVNSAWLRRPGSHSTRTGPLISESLRCRLNSAILSPLLPVALLVRHFQPCF